MLTSKSTRARWLALSLLSGSWEQDAIADRLSRSLPQKFEHLAALVARIRIRFDGIVAPGVDDLTGFLLSEPMLENVLRSDFIKGVLLDAQVMGPAPDALVTFPLPDLATWSDVGSWLSLSDKELAWFADCRSLQAGTAENRLHHYYYAWVAKRSGDLRLIEAPKSRMKKIQRQILHEILNRVPPHGCAHGFSRGRSTKTYVLPHIGSHVVIRLDLKDFFHSVPVARIGALFRSLGYPKTVAWLLQGLSTNSVAGALAGKPFQRLPWEVRKRLEGKHLPQGAPTSAQLANLCAWRLDCRLEGFAKSLGAEYSRYADDMAISGPRDLARRKDFVEAMVGAIAIDEGFRLNHRKTRTRLRSQRQRLAGIVVNEKSNCRREEWDLLKATLYNCVKQGPRSQNRSDHPNFRAHLQGRLAYVSWLNPSRAEKLQVLWDQIDWDG